MKVQREPYLVLTRQRLKLIICMKVLISTQGLLVLGSKKLIWCMEPVEKCLRDAKMDKLNT